jgi:hypothetical protein
MILVIENTVKVLLMAESVENLKGWSVIKNTTSHNTRGWKYFDPSLCFDGQNLIVLNLAQLFQQTRTLSSVS